MLVTMAFQQEGMKNIEPSLHNHDLMRFNNIICFRIQHERNFQLPSKCGLFLFALFEAAHQCYELNANIGVLMCL